MTSEEIIVAKVAKPKGEKVMEGVGDTIAVVQAAFVLWKLSKYAVRIVQKTKV